MSVLRERMLQDLKLGGYAERTIDTYVASICAYAKFHRRSPDQLDQEGVRAGVAHLTQQRIGPQRLRQHFAALRFVYGKTLGQPQVVSFLSWPREPDRLPVVLGADEVDRLLVGLKKPKFRVLFTTIYATGLRISEACRLTVNDIDASRGVIHVRLGKGDKERIVMLSPRLLAILRAYWRQERRAAPYLFTGKAGRPLNRDVARKAMRRASAGAGVAARA